MAGSAVFRVFGARPRSGRLEDYEAFSAAATALAAEHELPPELLDEVLSAAGRPAENPPPPSRSANSWTFQANPTYYDIDRALQELPEIEWTVRQSRRSVHQGDRAYIWRELENVSISDRNAGKLHPLDLIRTRVLVRVTTAGQRLDRSAVLSSHLRADRYGGELLRSGARILGTDLPCVQDPTAGRGDVRVNHGEALRHPLPESSTAEHALPFRTDRRVSGRRTRREDFWRSDHLVAADSNGSAVSLVTLVALRPLRDLTGLEVLGEKRAVDHLSGSNSVGSELRRGHGVSLELQCSDAPARNSSVVGGPAERRCPEDSNKQGSNREDQRKPVAHQSSPFSAWLSRRTLGVLLGEPTRPAATGTLSHAQRDAEHAWVVAAEAPGVADE
jgi:hypothetical protein